MRAIGESVGIILSKKCTKCLLEQDLKKFSNYYKNNKQYKSSQCNKCRRLTPTQERTRDYRLLYNITIKDYDLMYNNQNGKCFICEDFFDKLHVDHCHKTNKVRGLLCNHCNLALGKFKDCTKRLMNAINYLQKASVPKLTLKN